MQISVNYYILHAEEGRNMGGCGHAYIMKPGRRLRPTEKRQIQMDQMVEAKLKNLDYLLLNMVEI